MALMRNGASVFLAMCIAAGLSGCGMLQGPMRLLSDDAPRLVVKKARVKVAVEQPPGSGEWVEYGWVDLEPGDGIVPNAIDSEEWMGRIPDDQE